MERFIAFDVETPNYYNDRMSQIGIAVVEGGRIVERYSSLVDPEEHFDRFNILLTGITPEAVRGAPTFDRLWEEIRPIMTGGVLVAHNAAFDLGVLTKCLRAYCIDPPEPPEYLCTVQLGRRACPRLQDHKLDTLCRHFDIPLDHHRADSDASACAELLIEYGRMGLVPEEYKRRYDLSRGRTIRTIQ
ncbi:MAG: 3'-5' exonuclease [Clostridia bacterium]|nr:3'-5' exonuclease [Clostridia bacterium]